MNDLHEHLSPEQANAYAGRQLPPVERLAASDHLAACAACRTLVARAAPAAQPPASIFTDLIAAAREADGPLDDGWQSDAALPPRTAEELMELREFEATMAGFEPERFAPGGTLREEPARARRRQPVSTASDGWWRWLTTPWAVGLATAAVVMAVWLVRVTPGPAGRTGGAGSLVDGPLVVRADGGLEGMLTLPADLRDAVLETVRRGSVPGALLGTVTRGDSATPEPAKAEDPLFVPASPVGVVETDRPAFHWKSTLTTSGEVVVEPSAGGDPVLSGELPPGSREWTAPLPFARGRLYRWRVKATGKTTQSVMFKVLSTEAHTRLETLRGGPAGRSHLALGVAYAREGMHAEARDEFRRLESENAGSPLAQQLLSSAETW